MLSEENHSILLCSFFNGEFKLSINACGIKTKPVTEL